MAATSDVLPRPPFEAMIVEQTAPCEHFMVARKVQLWALPLL